MNRSMRTAAVMLAAAVLLPAAVASVAAQASPGEETTYLIRGGTIVNPGGQRLPNTDILVRNNRIV